GFGDLLAIKTNGAGLHLLAGNGDDLMGLDMRTECLVVLIAIGLDAGDIGGKPVLVDHRHRGCDLVERCAGFWPRIVHDETSLEKMRGWTEDAFALEGCFNFREMDRFR